MKKLLFVIVLIGAATLANAQSPINVGIKLGGNFSDVNLEFNDPDYTNIDYKRQFGFVAGGFVRINLGKISIQPEVLYSQKKYSTDADVANNIPEQDITLNELDVPVLIGYNLVDAKLVKLRIVAGPTFSYALSQDGLSFNGQSAGFDFDEALENAKFGYAAGLSLDVTKLTFDIRYCGQFSDTVDFSKLQDFPTDAESKLNWVQFTVGFKFL